MILGAPHFASSAAVAFTIIGKVLQRMPASMNLSLRMTYPAGGQYQLPLTLCESSEAHLRFQPLVHSSAAPSLTELIVQRLEQEGDAEKAVSPNFLSRNWPPAFKEW